MQGQQVLVRGAVEAKSEAKAAPAPKAKAPETAVAGSAAPAKAEAAPEGKVTTDDDLDSFLDDLNI